jgi:two-component system KDP operon response regulator KdpE
MSLSAQAAASSSPSPSPREARLLVVEDDEAMCRAIVAGLAARGYGVCAVATGRDALSDCAEQPPDVVLLDLGLPDLDGVEVCRRLRLWTQNPILVLTADGAEDRKILALDSGADDYITKPFSMPELHARIRVALRHRRALAPIVDGAVLEVGCLRIDLGGHVASLGGAHLDLTRREFVLLALFAMNCGRVLTHNHILAHAWDDAGLEKLPALRKYIFVLRKKLEDHPLAPLIVTESGTGYRMLCPE